MSDLQNLPSGNKWYSYSGLMSGGPTLPATVELVKISSTGLKDSYVKITPFFGVPITNAAGDAIGIKIFINQVAVYESQPRLTDYGHNRPSTIIELFIPKQSELQILSLNTANNSLQERGCTVLGWAI